MKRAASRRGLAAIGLLLTASALSATEWPAAPEVASYQIDATLDPVSKTVTGTAEIAWTNTTASPAADLRFHLYMNAFRDRYTTFARGNSEVPADFEDWGGIELQELSVGGRAIEWSFIAPDDHNARDQTVVTAALPDPVRPGDTVRIHTKFQTRLPRCVSRTGYSGDFVMLAQWYPKLGVFEDGSWNCHQFHADSEFYADFGRYLVTLRLPAPANLVATGVELSRETKNTTVVVKYQAIGVTDFAAAIQPTAVIQDRTWTSPSGRTVTLRLFLQREHLRFADRHARAMEAALAFLEDWCGPYPFPALTLVDPPWNAIATAGGMEYPMLFTTGTPLLESPHAYFDLEGMTVHEAGHQYFQHILASNEFEEPWVDEGINSYVTGKILAASYGPSELPVKYRGIPIGWLLPLSRETDEARAKREWLEDPESDPSTLSSYGFRDSYSYFEQVYDRPHIALIGLERSIGQAEMREIFRRYYAAFAFRHPRGRDFLEIVREVGGSGPREVLEQFLSRAEAPDVRIERVRERSGIWAVTLGRYPVLAFPVDLRVRFTDGTEEWRRWEGPTRMTTMRFSKAVEAAEVDPRRRIALDTNEINNSWTAHPRTGFIWSWSSLCAALSQLLLAP